MVLQAGVNKLLVLGNATLRMVAQTIVAVAGYLVDEFTDADGTDITSHAIAPANVPGAAWVQSLGTCTFQIISNQLKRVTRGSFQSQVTCDSGVSDLVVSSTAVLAAGGDGFGGLLLRHNASTKTCFRGEAQYNDGRIAIMQQIDNTGDAVIRATAGYPDMPNPLDMTFTAQGTDLAFTAGTKTANYSSAGLGSQTGVGVGMGSSSGAGGTIEDFTVEPL